MLAYLNRIIELLSTVSVDDILIETLICVEVEMMRTGVRALKSTEQSCACSKCEINHA